MMVLQTTLISLGHIKWRSSRILKIPFHASDKRKIQCLYIEKQNKNKRKSIYVLGILYFQLYITSLPVKQILMEYWYFWVRIIRLTIIKVHVIETKYIKVQYVIIVEFN